MPRTHQQLLVDLLTLPTSPFNEQHVIAYIRTWAAARPNIELTSDKYANLRLRLLRGRPVRSPLVLAAHMDHPGFQAVRMVGRDKVRAIWRGGVAPEYFKGAGVRFFSAGQWIRGRITDLVVGTVVGRKRVRQVTASVAEKVAPGSIGMWDLPDPQIRGNLLAARGCDDVGGVAAILAAFDVLASKRGPVDVYALLNRAEEVGFAGAMAGCQSGLVPRNARIISIETSSEKAGVKLGDGPILRVGDLSSIFTPDLTAWVGSVAADLQKSRPEFRYQRKLMDGGTCEASAYADFGYEATGLCVGLRNYHNQGPRGRIGAESIDLRDWHGMVDWFVALATTRRPYVKGNPPLRKRLQALQRKWTPLLKKTTGQMGRFDGV